MSTQKPEKLSPLQAVAFMAKATRLFGLPHALEMFGHVRIKQTGKGRRNGISKSWFSACAFNPGGKYEPHQGKRECARRVRQMQRSAA